VGVFYIKNILFTLLQVIVPKISQTNLFHLKSEFRSEFKISVQLIIKHSKLMI